MSDPNTIAGTSTANTWWRDTLKTKPNPPAYVAGSSTEATMDEYPGSSYALTGSMTATATAVVSRLK